MKKIVRIAFIAAVAAVAGLGVYTSQGEEIGMSDVALANVEALAGNETGGRVDPNTFYGHRQKNCYNKNGAIIGSTCEQGNWDDQCRRYNIWGECK